MRQDVKYFKFPLKESVQDWRNKWFYIKDEATDGHPINFPPFEDVMIAKPKKTWANIIPAEQEEVVETLYQRVQKIRLVRNQTSIGTEIVAHFLKRRIQPPMAREHPMYDYSGPEDPTRLDEVDLDDDQLTAEVRRLTKLSKKDKIQLAPLRQPFDADHQPNEV